MLAAINKVIYRNDRPSKFRDHTAERGVNKAEIRREKDMWPVAIL
jgi:hypothetical protein